MSGAPGIEEIKLAYRIPAAWRDLQLDGEPGKCVRSPFRDEKNPSFSVHDDGRRWKDFASGESGDVLDFVGRATGKDTSGALGWIRERLGFIADVGGEDKKDSRKKPRIPELRFASPKELCALNEQRLWHRGNEAGGGTGLSPLLHIRGTNGLVREGSAARAV